MSVIRVLVGICVMVVATGGLARAEDDDREQQIQTAKKMGTAGRVLTGIAAGSTLVATTAFVIGVRCDSSECFGSGMAVGGAFSLLSVGSLISGTFLWVHGNSRLSKLESGQITVAPILDGRSVTGAPGSLSFTF